MNYVKLIAERDALAAQVAQLHGTLGKALDLAETGAANNWYLEGADDIWIIDALKEHAKGIPDAQQHLRQIQADAGCKGYLQGIYDWRMAEVNYQNFDITFSATEYANKIRQGGE